MKITSPYRDHVKVGAKIYYATEFTLAESASFNV